MKYKLVKYDDNDIKGYVDIYGIINIYNAIGDKLVINQKKHLKYIEPDTFYKNLYHNLVKKIDMYINNKKYNTLIKQTEGQLVKQTGGQLVALLPLILSGVSSCLVVGSVIAYIVYRFMTAPKCRLDYPLSIGKKIRYKDIILQIMPERFLLNYLPNLDILNIDDNQLTSSLNDYLGTFSMILEIIAPDSILGQIITGAVEFVAGIAITAATAATAGAAVVINYLLKAFNLLKDAIGFLLKFIDTIINITKILSDEESKRVIHDLFIIDFRDGPFGVKCWVEYVMSKYGKNNEFIKQMCKICNSILSTIYSKLISFISKAISFAVPDGGITGLLFSSFMSVLKCKTYDFALLRLNKAYDKMSYDNQLLFEKPALMKKTLDNHLANAKGFFDFINNNVIQKIADVGGINTSLKSGISNVYQLFVDNTDLFSYVINKVFAIVFALMQVLSTCAKQGFCDTLLDQFKP